MGLFAEVDLLIVPFLSSSSDHFDLTVLLAISSCLPVLVTQESGIGRALRKISHGDSRFLDCDDPGTWRAATERVPGEKRTLRFGEATALRAAWDNAHPWTKQCRAEALVKWVLKVGSNNQTRFLLFFETCSKTEKSTPFG